MAGPYPASGYPGVAVAVIVRVGAGVAVKAVGDGTLVAVAAGVWVGGRVGAGGKVGCGVAVVVQDASTTTKMNAMMILLSIISSIALVMIPHFAGIANPVENRKLAGRYNKKMAHFSKDALLRWLVPILAGAFLTIWLVTSPPGLLGKLDALGYSVCHRLPGHSFLIEGRALPLCARCSGMYLGILTGLAFLLPRRKPAGFPRQGLLAVLGLFLAFFALDGINSVVELASGQELLYPPQNNLRVLTGSLVGLGMAIILVPVINQVAWRFPDPSPVVASWREFGRMSLAALLPGGLLILDNVLVNYLLALLSGAAVLVFLTLIHTTLWVMVLRKWNSFESWREMARVLGIGAASALFQVLLVDLIRYSLTGSWGGAF